MPEETMREFILKRQPCWPMRDIAKELGVPKINSAHWRDDETIVVTNAKGNEVIEIISPSALKNRKPKRRPGRGPSGPKTGVARKGKLPAVNKDDEASAVEDEKPAESKDTPEPEKDSDAKGD